MVTVVYRLESSIESKPSAIARSTSFVVTSSHTQTNDFSCRFLSSGRGRGSRVDSPRR